MTKSTSETRQIHCKLDFSNYHFLLQVADHYGITIAAALNVVLVMAKAGQWPIS